MNAYPQHVSGCFSHRQDAEKVSSRLMKQGLPQESFHIFAADAAPLSDALSNGQVVLVVDTRTRQETSIARAVIQAAVGEYKDILVAAGSPHAWPEIVN